MASRQISLLARDGRALTGTLWEREKAEAPSVLIAGATGVPQRFYAKFAGFLAERGFRVLTLDYRGIGRSALGPARRESTQMHHWGELDLSSALDWLAQSRPDSPLCWVGHSAGGQLLGLVERPERLSRIALVACQSGYWRWWPPRERYVIRFAYGLFSLYASVFGYLPGRFLGGGESLPRGVAVEWGQWGCHPDYILSHGPEVAGRFAAIGCPVALLGFSDDFFAPKAAVDAMADWFLAAPVQRRHIRPEDIGAGRIGHFSAFRDRFKESLWVEIACHLGDDRGGP